MSFASSMVTAIQTALSTNPAAIVSIKFSDGRSMQYDRNQALEELAYWQRQVDAETYTTTTGGLQMQRMGLKGDA